MQIEKLIAKDGQPILKLDGYYLHSRYQPLAEAESFAERHYKEHRVHILYGVGAKHFLKALLKIRKHNEKIIVVDPLLSLDEQFDHVVFHHFLNQIELELFLTTELTSSANVQVLLSPNYDQIHPVKYSEFLKAIKHVLHIFEVDRNTILSLSADWQANLLVNLPSIVADQSISKLEGKFDCPVIIAAGGPSLTKQLPLLKEYAERCLIISAGSTIQSLLAAGIEPDFIVSVDGSAVNEEHFKEHQFQHSRLVYSQNSYPAIRQYFGETCYYFLSDPSHDNVAMERIAGERPVVLYGGSSVANFAFAFAMYVSTGPVALIGQDLAYTNYETHAEHNKQRQKITVNLFEDNRYFLTTSYDGGEVYTDYSLESMKRAFELQAKFNRKEKDLYNCTEGGAFIRYFKNISLKEFLVTFVQDDSITVSLTESLEDGESRLLSILEDELLHYEALERILLQSIKLVEKKSLKGYFHPKVLAKLEKNDKKMNQLIEKTLLKQVINKINLMLTKYFQVTQQETQEATFSLLQAQSHFLYGQLLEAVQANRQTVLQVMKQLTKERVEVE